VDDGHVGPRHHGGGVVVPAPQGPAEDGPLPSGGLRLRIGDGLWVKPSPPVPASRTTRGGRRADDRLTLTGKRDTASTAWTRSVTAGSRPGSNLAVHPSGQAPTTSVQTSKPRRCTASDSPVTGLASAAATAWARWRCPWPWWCT
jgi:hypothetical protein